MTNSALLVSVSIGTALIFGMFLLGNAAGVVGDWATGQLAIVTAGVGFTAPLALAAIERALDL